MATRKQLFNEWANTVWADNSAGMAKIEKQVYVNGLGAWLKIIASQQWATDTYNEFLNNAATELEKNELDSEEEKAVRAALSGYLHHLSRYCALHKLVARAQRPKERGLFPAGICDILRSIERYKAVTAVKEEMVFGIPPNNFIGSKCAVTDFVEQCRNGGPVSHKDGKTHFGDNSPPPSDSVAYRACLGQYLFGIENLLHSVDGELGDPESHLPEGLQDLVSSQKELAKFAEQIAKKISVNRPVWQHYQDEAWAQLQRAIPVDEITKTSEVDYPINILLIRDVIELKFRGRSTIENSDINNLYYAKKHHFKRRQELSINPRRVSLSTWSDSGESVENKFERTAYLRSDRLPPGRAIVERKGASKMDIRTLTNHAASYLREVQSPEGTALPCREIDIAIALLEQHPDQTVTNTLEPGDYWIDQSHIAELHGDFSTRQMTQDDSIARATIREFLIEAIAYATDNLQDNPTPET